MIDTENDNSNNKFFDKMIPNENDVDVMAPILIQGLAALEPAKYSDVLARLIKLKIVKTARNMDDNTESIFLDEIANHIYQKKINYQFIDKGIFDLIEKEDDKWFPEVKTILQYVCENHNILKARMTMLNEILMRYYDQKLIK